MTRSSDPLYWQCIALPSYSPWYAAQCSLRTAVSVTVTETVTVTAVPLPCVTVIVPVTVIALAVARRHPPAPPLSPLLFWGNWSLSSVCMFVCTMALPRPRGVRNPKCTGAPRSLLVRGDMASFASVPEPLVWRPAKAKYLLANCRKSQVP